MSIVINKNIWIKSFSAGVPTKFILEREIQQLLNRLELDDTNKQARSRLCNSLRRRQKMLAAVKDGQPWAWVLYPSSCPAMCVSS